MKKVLVLVFSLLCVSLFGGRSFASSCVDIEFVFARGSGGVYQENIEWLTYRRAMTKMADRIGMASYRFTEVDYPAVSVAIPANAIGAYVSAGKYYKFGKSVNSGVDWLRNYYAQVMRSCPTTRWVLAGYSQGAMVVAMAANSFSASKVIYIGLVADPQTYLPEGGGILPDACLGRNYSEYRVFVPACRTHKGSLGARNPYQYGTLAGKYGLWCGKKDYICGSSSTILANSGHTQYVAAGSYTQMAYLVQQKLTTSYSPVRSVRSAVETEIYALLGQDEYFARPDDEVFISAEPSFSTGGAIVSYEWAIDDGDFAIGENSLQTKFAVGAHRIQLRVTDRTGATAQTEAQVTVADSFSDDRLPAPTVRAERQADAAYFTWQEIPPGAQYLLVRLNGFDLDYVDADKYVIGIHDLEISESDQLSVAWLDADLNVGTEYAIKIVDIEEVDELSHEQYLQPKDFDTPQTGIDLRVGVVIVALLLATSLIIIKNTRHGCDGCTRGSLP